MDNNHNILTSVRNPLSIIALFVLLIEMVATVAMSNNCLTVDQRYWFVVFCTIFPVLVLLIFFLIVWNRPVNFYGPHDYNDENIYLKLMRQGKMEDEINEVIESETETAYDSRMEITNKVANAERCAINELQEEFKAAIDRQVISADRTFLYDAIIKRKEGMIYVEVKYVNKRFLSQKTLDNIKLFAVAGGKERKILAIVTPMELNTSEKDKFARTIANIDKDMELRFYNF